VRTQARFLVQMAMVMDTLLVAACLCVTWNNPRGATPAFFVALLIVPSWISLLRFFGVYDSQRLNRLTGTIRRVVSAHFIGGLCLALAIWAVGGAHDLRSAVGLVCLSTAVIVAEKTAINVTLKLMRRKGLDARSVLIVSSWDQAEKIGQTFKEHPEWGLAVTCVGTGQAQERTFFDFERRQELGNQLEAVIEKRVIDELLIAVPPDQLGHEQATVQVCERYGILGRIMLVGPRYLELESSESFCGSVCFPVATTARITSWGLALKRGIDLTFSLLLLVLLAPLLAVIALAVKLSTPGPVIFRQTRVGLRGRKFTLYKFRTMVDRAEAMLPALAARTIMRGPIYKSTADPRVTDIGRVLRKFSLDELPQLVNVLKGEMSLVGPRPLPTGESDAIPGEFRRRFSMRPGLTCLWQVNGRSNVEYHQWMQYDLQYVDSWSVWLDAKLMVQTIPVVLGGKGAY